MIFNREAIAAIIVDIVVFYDSKRSIGFLDNFFLPEALFVQTTF